MSDLHEERAGYTVLFQGDSITDGSRVRDNALVYELGHGYPNLIAAKLGEELAAIRPRFINRGLGGNRVADLYARWNEDAIALQPDLISILIGANDLWQAVLGQPGGVTDRFARAYRHLLDDTQAALPATRLVLCEPFILNTGATSSQWADWQARLVVCRETTKELAAQYGALFVPLQDAFDRATAVSEPAYWLRDGVHPTAAGHQLIANQWLSVVQPAVPALSGR